MKKTTNYGLSQYEPADAVRREDFNADNAKIDAAIKAAANAAATAQSAASAAQTAADTAQSTASNAVAAAGGAAHIAYGTYTGTGKYGSGNPNAVTVDFEPKVLMVNRLPVSANFTANSSTSPEIVAMLILKGESGHYVNMNSDQRLYVTWGSRSVKWYSSFNANMQHNVTDTTYAYAVLG